MDHIETKILNSYTIQEAAQNMVFAARLTQQGHSIQNMDDLMALYQKSFTDKTVDRIASLPHPTVQKFTVITVAIVGASRRFLAQITRHQNEVKFMSASLQYSNYSEKAAFTIPYEILFSEQRYINLYLQSCLSDLRCYQELCSVGFHHDSAGYALPHALRNILIICATPYEWKHMISQRICRRNTDETRIVMLDIWQKLYEFDPVLFSPKLTGPFCQRGCCEEGTMSCGIPIPKEWSPLEIMKADYPLLVEGTLFIPIVGTLIYDILFATIFSIKSRRDSGFDYVLNFSKNKSVQLLNKIDKLAGDLMSYLIEHIKDKMILDKDSINRFVFEESAKIKSMLKITRQKNHRILDTLFSSISWVFFFLVVFSFIVVIIDMQRGIAI